MFDFLLNLANWFVRPSVAAWAGAVAAIIAAMSIEPKTWRQKPVRALKRSLRVAVIWLILAFLLTQWLPPGFGGKGTGGGKGETTGGSVGTLDLDQKFISDATLLIQFRPRSDDPGLAKDFSCVLQWTQKNQPPTNWNIETGSMMTFEKEVKEKLQSFPPVSQLVVVIDAQPFPGNGLIKKLESMIRKELGEVRIEINLPK